MPPATTFKKELLEKELPEEGRHDRRFYKFMKTLAQRERHKRWLRKHPAFVLAQLKNWVEKEEDPKEKERAKKILEKFFKHNPEMQKKELPDTEAGEQDTLKLDAKK